MLGRSVRIRCQSASDRVGDEELASATLHTIAIRARAGVPCAELREIARKVVSVICG
jgi:hypothetical protein